MIKKMAWFVILAAAAAGGCLTGSGAIRGATVERPGVGSAQGGPGTTIPAATMSR